jgi:hypothetical protein
MKKPFDILGLYSKFAREHQISLFNPDASEKFISHTRGAIEQALKDRALLHGQRVQNMFEAMVVSLNHFELLKIEDAGRLHTRVARRPPDFRIVLKDGSRWLVEVKNVYLEDIGRQRKRLMSGEYLRSLQRYASAVGCQLKVAIYWARWGVWTLVAPERLQDGGGLTVGMREAICLDEMSALGDMMLGTTPPLRLRFFTDKAEPSVISENRSVRFKIGSVQLFCGDAEIVDPGEQRIAWMLMQFGEWTCEEEPKAILSGNQLEAIEYEWQPRERVNNQPFEMIGRLSRMFSRYYALHTLNGSELKHIEAKFAPDWLGPLTSREYKGIALPLWRF